MISEKAIIRLVLAVGLIHGLLFVFFIPPWEHYDEPAHFEYAWLIANRLSLPKPGDFDVNMRLALGKSLITSKFFEKRSSPTPNLTDPSQPLWVGVTQLTDPPLYYIYSALPLLILRDAPIDTQLHGGRIFSILFFLLTVWAAYLILVELTPPKSFLRWLVPLFLALLPGLVDVMTSVNDHVAAIGVVSLWLLVATRLVKRGLSLDHLAYLILLDVVCVYTQKVAWIVLPLTLPVLLLSATRKVKVWLGWAILAAAGIGAAFILFQWNDAALWLRRNYQDTATRVSTGLSAPFSTALQAKLYPDTSWAQADPSWNAGFLQLLPENQVKPLGGKVVTLGAWVWADKNVTIYGPGLNALYGYNDRWFGFPKISVGTTPVFVSSTFQLPPDEGRIQIWLRTTTPDQVNGTLYFTGVVMAEGRWPVGTAPQFNAQNGAGGTWGGKPFVNLVRNSFMLGTWPYPKPKVLNFVLNHVSGLEPTHVSSIIALALDWKGTAWYTLTSSAVIFRTFWAKFCWGQVPLFTTPLFVFRPYAFLLALSLIGFLGCIFAAIRWFKKIPWNEILFLIVAAIGVIILAYFYGVYSMGGGLRFRTYYPVARYMYSAVIPIGSIFVCGWSSWYSQLRSWIRIPAWLAVTIFLVFMVGLDIYSFVSIVHYFRSF